MWGSALYSEYLWSVGIKTGDAPVVPTTTIVTGAFTEMMPNVIVSSPSTVVTAGHMEHFVGDAIVTTASTMLGTSTATLTGTLLNSATGTPAVYAELAWDGQDATTTTWTPVVI